MRIKSYYAGTVEAAMERARRELGEEAVLLHAHPAPAEARHLGAHEVVFGVEGEAPASSGGVLASWPAAPARPLEDGYAKRVEWLPDRSHPELTGRRTATQATAVPRTAVQQAAVQQTAVQQTAVQATVGHTANGTVVDHPGHPINDSHGRSHRDVAAAEATNRDRESLPPTDRPASEGSSAFVQFLTARDFPAGHAESLAQEVACETERRLRRQSGSGFSRPSRTAGTRATDGDAAAARETLETPATGFGGGTGFGGDTGFAGDTSYPAIAKFRRRGPVADTFLAVLASKLSWAELSDPGSRVLALLGPPGAGKTTTLVKLAATWSLECQGRTIDPDRAGDQAEAQPPVAILSADTLGVAASEQLRTYSVILGVSCEVVETPLAMERAIAAIRRRQPQARILIDTPGWSPAQLANSAKPWLEFFAHQSDITRHLVLPATMAPREFAAAAVRFAPFGVSRLMLTRIDELTSGGALAGSLLAACLPVSLLGTGQSIPEDWESASVARLVDLILTDAGVPSRAAPPARRLNGLVPGGVYAGDAGRPEFARGELTHV